jgi:hypothetical protein
MKKRNIIFIIVILLILVGLLIVWLFRSKGLKNDDNVDAPTKVLSIEKDLDSQSLVFYEFIGVDGVPSDNSEGNLLSTYNCSSKNCWWQSLVGSDYVVAIKDYVTNTDNGIDESMVVVFWDVYSGKEIAKVQDIVTMYVLNEADVNPDVKYLVLLDKTDKAYIYDENGNYVREMSNKFVVRVYEGGFIAQDSYFAENNVIVTIKNNKYGIEKISNDRVLFEHTFDDVRLYDISVKYTSADGNMTGYNAHLYSSKYFKAKNGNKWSLYNFNNGSKVIDDVYNNIYLIDENIIAVHKDGYISFIDYTGKSVCDEKIKVENYVGMMPKNPEGIQFTVQNNMVNIVIYEGTDPFDTTYLNYEYNLENNTLKKLK